MRKLIFLVPAILIVLQATGQKLGQLTGVVTDRNTKELLIGVTVLVEGISPAVGAVTDAEGRYRLTDVPTGSYNLKASYVGYEPLTRYNVVISSGNAGTLNFELQPSANKLSEVEVRLNRSIQVATPETPLSIQNLTSEEIKSNPGGNFDISRVVQSLPGVGGAAGTGGGFRNDIIIRGGAPNENVYYLDGIEIPVINHFSTQGSAGGPQGMLNVAFIEDVTLSSSAFDARFDNALASVFQFRQREGNPDRLQGNIRLSATELALTGEGPLSDKTTFLVSARRSYLELLFKAIDLPIRPDYWDFQYKVTHKLSSKTTLTALGVGAIDEFAFGVPRNTSPEKEYTLRSVPSINQWNYTVGFSAKTLIENGYINLALSRNMFNNDLDKFEDGLNGDESRRVLRARSQEMENKFRVDVNKYLGSWKFSYGGVGQYVRFKNNIFNVISRPVTDGAGNVLQPGYSLNFNTELDLFRYGLFGQATGSFLNDRLSMSLGIRSDMNSFTNTGLNPLKTFSPRLSGSYALTDRWKLNASVGRYYKLPIYTALGFRSETGDYVNKDNLYIRSDHYVGGLEFLPTAASRITLEGFYKRYANYPVSVRNGISLANLGTGFGAIGNEDVVSTGLGRAYGMEFFFQQKLSRNMFGVFSYTFVRSEYTGLDQAAYIPSVWDNRHLVSALFGRKLGRGWELGLKYRYAGGAPYTPFDPEASRRDYYTTGTGVENFSLLNTERLIAFNQFDFRIDKKWNFKRVSLDVFLDLQNAFRFKSPSLPQYTFQRTPDNSGFATTDGQALEPNGSNAIPVILTSDDPTFLPSVGFILEF